MTWGQLRLLLQKSGPDVDLDLIDGWLNARYEQVLEKTDWLGLDGHATIQTQAAYQSVLDTVTFTVGSVAVVGLGTAWTALNTGPNVYRPGDAVTYVATWVSGTSLTLDRPYEGTGMDAPGTVYAGAAYVFMRNVYELPADCSSVVSILNPVTGLPMQPMTKPELDASAGERTLLDNPGVYAIYDDSAETSPPVLHQVEFYPPPKYARGCVLNYRRAALGFDGGNTSGSPLPFISMTVLLAGVRADMSKHLKDLAQAALYEGDFKTEVAAMLLVEHAQRRKKPVMRMAARFVRHRLARVERGSNTWFSGTEKPGV